MRYAAALLLALAALPGARAATWIAVPLTPQADLYYYDRSKLYIEREEITYWKKVLFRTPQPTKEGTAVSGLFRERIHCAEHTLRLISYLLTAADGRTIEYVENKEGGAAPIIPDSVGDAFENVLCKLVKARQEEQRLADEAAKAKEAEKAAAALIPAAPLPAATSGTVHPQDNKPASDISPSPATSPTPPSPLGAAAGGNQPSTNEDKPPATPPEDKPPATPAEDKPPAKPPEGAPPPGPVKSEMHPLQWPYE